MGETIHAPGIQIRKGRERQTNRQTEINIDGLRQTETDGDREKGREEKRNRETGKAKHSSPFKCELCLDFISKPMGWGLGGRRGT